MHETGEENRLDVISEEHYRAAFQYASMGMCFVGRDSKFIRVNQKFCEITGYSENEIVGRSFQDITHPDDLSIGRDRLDKLISGEVDHAQFIKRYIHKNGKIIWGQFNTASMRDRDGVVTLFVTQLQDITESREIEEALRSSEQQYRMLFEAANDPVCVADAETGVVVDCNDAACALWKCTKEKLIGRHQSELHPKEKRRDGVTNDSLRESFKKHLNEKRGQVLEEVIQTCTGELRDVIINANVFEWQGRKLLQGTFHDITDQKRFVKAQEENLKFRTTLLNVIPLPVYFKDKEGRFIACNKAFEQLVGASEREINGRTSDDFFPSSVLPPLKDSDVKLLAGEPIQVFELGLPLLGQQIDLRFHKAAFFDEEGKISGIVGVVIDLTEIKKAEKEQQRIQAQLIQSDKLASIGTLAAGVAHEINNPLTIIKGNISILAELLEGGPTKPLELLDRQSKAVDRVAAIVNTLRTYARANTDVVENINIHKVISDTLGLCETIYRKAKVSITTSFECQAPIVSANAGKLQQVLMNLLSNAKDACESVHNGGAIRIETALEECDGQKYSVIRVIDNGTGIDAKHIGAVFDPFFTTKPQGKGTGLGLAISHSIIRSFGGDISVASQPFHGAKFTIKMPIAAEQRSTEDAFQRTRLAVRMSGRALVVDDEIDIRHTVGALLRGFGLEVIEADDGDTALEILKKAHFDYVVTDLTMPRVNGEVLLADARKLTHLRSTYFLVITGGSGGDYTHAQRAAIKELANGVLNKPFDKEELAKILLAGKHTRQNPIEI